MQVCKVQNLNVSTIYIINTLQIFETIENTRMIFRKISFLKIFEKVSNSLMVCNKCHFFNNNSKNNNFLISDPNLSSDKLQSNTIQFCKNINFGPKLDKYHIF
ncbi:hypothetical protein PanWU01x14_290310 [Parasponia andersonii]|uniref:Uncharacterized protein n=1 Tax=Parasponia andersonii TaxID=3476 RepID=A0A2P5AXS2_PARAD|nr:hypothetical protein PanWU01x14_290310 [Parasponia andersonii]